MTDLRTTCPACGHTVTLELLERDESDGSLLTLLRCPDCGTEWPSSRTTPQGRALFDQVEAQRTRAGRAVGTPAYVRERERLDELLVQLKAEVRRP